MLLKCNFSFGCFVGELAVVVNTAYIQNDRPLIASLTQNLFMTLINNSLSICSWGSSQMNFYWQTWYYKRYMLLRFPYFKFHWRCFIADDVIDGLICFIDTNKSSNATSVTIATGIVLHSECSLLRI